MDNSSYSFDLFEQIYKVQQSAAEKLDVLSSNIVQFATTIKNKSEKTGDSLIDSLVSKMDSLMSYMMEMVTGKSATFDMNKSKESVDLVRDVAGLGVILSSSLPYFTMVRAKIPFIVGTISDIMVGLSRSMNGVSTRSVEKMSASVSFLSMDFAKFANSIVQASSLFDQVTEDSIERIGNKISLYVRSMAKKMDKVDEGTIRKLGMINNLINMDIIKFAKNLSSAIPMVKVAQFFSGMLGRSLATIIANLTRDIDPKNVNMLNTVLNYDFLSFIRNYAMSAPLIMLFSKLAPIISKALEFLITNIVMAFKNSGITEEDVDLIDKALSRMGETILRFSIQMVIASGLAFIADLIAEVLLGTIKSFITLFDALKKDGSNINVGTKLLMQIGFGLMAFAGFVMLAAKMLAAGGIDLSGIATLGGIIGGIVTLFSFIDVDYEKTLRTSRLLVFIGASLIAISASIWAATYFMTKGGVDIKSFLILGGIMVFYSFLYNVIGEKGDSIKYGALSIALIGLSMLSFSAGIMMSTIAMAGVGWENTLMLIGMLSITALLFYGIGQKAVEIALGALAMAVVGLSLMSIALGVKLILDSGIGENPNMMWQLPLFLLGLGAVFGLGGTFAVQIALGALAMAAVGIALAAIGWGLSMIPMKQLSENPIIMLQLPLFIGGLATVFGLAGMAAPFILAGAAAIGAMGLALISMGYGIKSIVNSGLNAANAMQIGSGIKILITKIGQSTEDLSIKDALLLPAKIALLAALGPSLRIFGWGLEKILSIKSLNVNSINLIGYAIKSIFTSLGKYGDEAFLNGIGKSIAQFARFAMILTTLNTRTEKYNKSSLKQYTQLNMLIKLKPGIDQFTKSMKDLTEVMKLQLDQFARTEAVANFTKYVEGFTKLEQVDLSKVKEVTSSVANHTPGLIQQGLEIIGFSDKDSKKETKIESKKENKDGLEAKLDKLIELMALMMADNNNNHVPDAIEKSMQIAVSPLASAIDRLVNELKYP